MIKNNSLTVVISIVLSLFLNSSYSNVKIKTVDKNQKAVQKAEQNQKLETSSRKNSSENLTAKLYLLEKLENLDRTLPQDYLGREALQLRIAHVLSLLAEENFIKSKEESCQSCFNKAQSQAKKSLSLYHKLSPVIFNGNQSFLQIEALFQKAYLERILGNRSSALSQLQKITEKKNIKAGWMIRAWYGIGEIEFELYNYQKALKAFNQTLKNLSNLNEKSKPAGWGLDKKQLSSWKFKALYHKIWSLFNLSSYDLALSDLLALIGSDLYKNNSSDFWLDKESQTLRSKLEKEILAIYSHTEITDQNLKALYDFSKQNKEDNSLIQRNKRLYDLASLLRKMGRFTESNKAWRFYLSKNLSKEDQLIAYFNLFKNKINLRYKNNLGELAPLVEKIMVIQKDLFSKKIKSVLSQKQDLYRYINVKVKEFFYQVDKIKLSLNKDQKSYLLSLYQKYNSQNPKDKDVLLLSAFLAENLEEYKLAVSLFQQSALYVKSINKIKDRHQLKWKEKFCVKQMELAELSKDKKTRLQAYDFYIQQGRETALKYKAIYQTAYLHHQDQEFSKSQPLFLKLALNEFNKKLSLLDKNKPMESKKVKRKGLMQNSSDHKSLQSKNKAFKKESPQKGLRLKSAHLYLSSLAVQKDRGEELIHASGLFKKEFPKEKNDFVKIYNLAILNYVEKLVKDKKFSTTPLTASQNDSIQKAWSVLQLFDSKFADSKPLQTYHFNRMILAKELLKIDELDQSLSFLLSNKKTSEKNKEIVLKEKLWLSELKFDFDQVLKLLKQLKPKDQSRGHSLRLIQIVELSNQSPSSYYKNFLQRFAKSDSTKKLNQTPFKASNSKTSQSQSSELLEVKLMSSESTDSKPVKLETLQSILVSLLERSEKEKQKQLLKTYSSLFKESPNDLLYWVLKIDEGELDRPFLNFFTENLQQDNTLQKNSFLSSFLKRKQNLESFQKALSFKKRDSKKVSISQIARVIKRYSDQLSKLEIKALSLLETEDWTTQVFVLGYWMRELKSFYSFVLQLPIPKGLTKTEQSEYKQLLVKQMQVYSNKIQELEEKQKQLFLSPFVSNYQKALQSYVFHPYLKWEIDQILGLLDKKDKIKMQSLLLQIEKKILLAKQNQIKESELDKIKSELQKIYKQLKSNPFGIKNLNTALKLEKQRDNKVRVRYLSNRIKQLESVERR